MLLSEAVQTLHLPRRRLMCDGVGGGGGLSVWSISQGHRVGGISSESGITAPAHAEVVLSGKVGDTAERNAAAIDR